MAESAEDELQNGSSGRDVILARQRRETKELRAKIQAMKRSVPKGDKKRKKDVTAEISRLEQEMEEQHKRELEAVEDDSGTADLSPNRDNSSAAVEHLAEQLEAGKVGEGGGGQEEDEGGGEQKPVKKSRAQKRKEKKALQEKERRQRMAEEEKAMASEDNPRLKEREKLETLLEPLSLAVQDIRPDGNCLYAAVSHQLSLRMDTNVTVAQLRSQCAGYLRAHSADFLPFLTDPQTGDIFSEDQFAHYCSDIETTAAWGGQLEIRALSHVYQVPITVYQAESPPVVVGEEYSHPESSLTLSYHHHEYGLGEHYNSLAPITR